MIKLKEEQKEKLKAGLELLCEDTTSIDKFLKISTMVKGVNPKIDEQLEKAQIIAEKLKLITEGDMFSLSAEKLPEKTKKQRKKKKLLLLFLSSLKDLKGEVARISDLHAAVTAGANGSSQAVKGGKILATLKGPLGAITIVAAGIVAVTTFANSKSVEVTVKNEGCRPIQPVIQKTINLPGLKLPSSPINSGGADVAIVPGLNMKVDMSQGGSVGLQAMGFSQSYGMPSEIRDITYDGQSLMGKVTQVELGKSKTHLVVVKCGR